MILFKRLVVWFAYSTTSCCRDLIYRLLRDQNSSDDIQPDIVFGVPSCSTCSETCVVCAGRGVLASAVDDVSSLDNGRVLTS